MNPAEFRVISIGTLAAHPLWNEKVEVRTGHATTVLVSTERAKVLVNPGLPGQVIAARLSERSNIKPEEITHVFLTTFAVDHYRGLVQFPEATWLVHAPERVAAAEAFEAQLDRARDLADEELCEAIGSHQGLLERCEPAEDSIAPGIDLFPLPGLTPGTCGLLLPLPRATVLICGDAVATVEHLDQGQVLPTCADIEQAQESLREAIEIADALIPGRDNLVYNPLRRVLQETGVFESVESPYLVPFDSSFRASESPTSTPGKDEPGSKECRKRLGGLVEELGELQHKLYAHDRYAVLLVFQAMDAGGKDSTIRAVMSGVNPAGCQVFSFKKPSPIELDHDFLWRTTRCLPERGRIGIFNRSHYEEVLVVRVHPEYLGGQKLPYPVDHASFWEDRYRAIRDHEQHLAESGTIILKFWLNVSKEEQRDRFLSRLDEPHKHWKFAAADVRERGYWDDYMRAYEDAVNATSRPWAPWFAVPADKKPFMRACVADIIVRSLQRLGLDFPEVAAKEREQFDAMRRTLEDDDG